MTKAQSIWVMVLGLGLISMSVYTINTYSKSGASATSKIIVDIFAVIFIIGGLSSLWVGGKSLAA